MTTACALRVEMYEPTHANEWRAFVESSENGTLFHDLDFLSYHPANRFDTHHLVFRRNGDVIGLLPAAIVAGSDGKRMLKSPYGASIGGPVLPVKQRAETTLSVVTELQGYVTDLDLAGIEMRIGPNIYARHPNDNLSFALTACGFAQTHRWLEHVIPLPSNPRDVLNGARANRRNTYHSALRRGLKVAPADADQLGPFYEILLANRAKHGARPTHTLSEIERIYQLSPNRVQLFACTLDSNMMAGLLVFELNDRVAYAFYLCHDDRFEEYRTSVVTTLWVASHYAGRGYRYLDLGPTSFDDLSLNSGLAAFKEELGGLGFCRDAWRWER